MGHKGLVQSVKPQWEITVSPLEGRQVPHSSLLNQDSVMLCGHQLYFNPADPQERLFNMMVKRVWRGSNLLSLVSNNRQPALPIRTFLSF